MISSDPQDGINKATLHETEHSVYEFELHTTSLDFILLFKTG